MKAWFLIPETGETRTDRQATRHLQALLAKNVVNFWHWNLGGKQGSMVTGPDSAARFVAATAKVVGCRPEETRIPSASLPANNIYSWQTTIRDPGASIGSGSGDVSFTEITDLLVRAIPAGCWVCLAVAAPKVREANLVAEWAQKRMKDESRRKIHWSADQNDLLIADLYMNIPSHINVKGVLAEIVAALPAFDLSVKPVKVGEYELSTAMFAAGGGIGLAGLLANTVGVIDMPALGTVPAVAAAGYVTATSLGYLGLNRLRMERQIRNWLLRPRRAPVRNIVLPTLWSAGAVKDGADDSEKLSARKTERKYPRVGGLMIWAQQVAAFANTRTGASETVAATQNITRQVPAASVLHGDGIFLGADSVGRAVKLKVDDMFSGVMVMGDPGTGKSLLLETVLASVMQSRIYGVQRPDQSGDRADRGKVTPIVFEEKTSHEHWSRITKTYDPNSMIIDAVDPSTYRLDVFAGSGSIVDRARLVASALREAFQGEYSDSAVMASSTALWLALLPVAAQITEGMCIEAKVPYRGVFGQAYCLLDGFDEDQAKRLATVFARHAGEAEHAAQANLVAQGSSFELGDGTTKALTPLKEAWDGWARYANKTGADRRNSFSASLNKFQQLAQVEVFENPRRKAVGWEHILKNRVPTIISFGSSSLGTVSEEASRVWTSLAFVTLRQQIQQHCVEWGTKRIGYTAVFCDEISSLAKSDSETITWLRNSGRSFGVWSIFATQYPGQLSREVLDAVMSFGSMIWLRLTSSEMRERAAADLGSPWTADDIRYASKLQGVARSSINGEAVPGYTLRVPSFWKVEMPDFARRYESERVPEEWLG